MFPAAASGQHQRIAFASRSGTGEHVTICSKLISLRPSFEGIYPPFLRFLFMLDIARRISFIHLIFPNPSRCSFPVLLLRVAAETHPRQVRGTPSTSPYQRVTHATWYMQNLFPNLTHHHSLVQKWSGISSHLFIGEFQACCASGWFPPFLFDSFNEGVAGRLSSYVDLDETASRLYNYCRLFF